MKLTMLTEEIAQAAGVTYEMAMQFADEGSPDYVQALLHAVEKDKAQLNSSARTQQRIEQQRESASGKREESQPLQANGHRSFASADCDVAGPFGR